MFVPAMKRKVYVRPHSWLARIAARKLGSAQIAIVFGHSIHLHNTSVAEFFAQPWWVCHELKHVEQYERLGILPFLFRYILEHLRNGYQQNAFEREARAAEGDKTLLDQYDLSPYQDYMIDGY